MFGLALVGGDTIACHRAARFSTAIGRAGKTPSRGRPGDRLWLSERSAILRPGWPNSSGIPRRKGRWSTSTAGRFLAGGRQALAPSPCTMMDVSDGLLLDLSRLIARASACDIELKHPRSEAFLARRGGAARLFAATGDDYSARRARPSSTPV